MKIKITTTLMKTVAICLLLATFLYGAMMASARAFSAYYVISFVALAASSLMAMYYLFAGFKKDEGSKYFKLFINVFAIFELITLADHQLQTSLEVMMVAIRFASLVLISQAKDLGEKKSTIISIIILITSIIDIINLYIDGLLTSLIFGIIIELLLEFSVLLMIKGKYADKALRGAK